MGARPGAGTRRWGATKTWGSRKGTTVQEKIWSKNDLERRREYGPGGLGGKEQLRNYRGGPRGLEDLPGWTMGRTMGVCVGGEEQERVVIKKNLGQPGRGS